MPHQLLAPIETAIQNGADTGTLLGHMEKVRLPLEQSLRRSAGSPAASLLALKVLNLLLAKHHFLARDVSLLSRPFGLVVDPINNCNLACPGCVHSERSRDLRLFQWDSGLLSPQKFAPFLDHYGPYAIEIMFCNYGEPLLNPETPMLIRMARTWLMRTGLSTNMTAPRFDAASYVESGLDFMTVSIDGATQPVYERYRQRGRLDVALRNLRSLIETRNRLGRQTPIVSWQFLAFEHNAHEIDQAIAIAREIGIDQFVVANPFDVGWDDPGVRPAALEARTVPFHADSDRRLIANWNPFPGDLPADRIAEAWRSWPGELDEGASQVSRSPGHTCHWLYKNLVMDANGRVLPCCAAPKPGTDLVFANALEQAGATESFNSPKYQLARLSFADRARYDASPRDHGDPYCANCDWNQTWAHTNSEQVEQYFRTAGTGLFDTREIALLSGW